MAVAMAAVAGVAGCAGPSRTDDDYRHKVANTAQSMSSAVSTAQLAVNIADSRRAMTPYVQQSLNDALNDATAVQNGFDAVQSPSAASDQLRTRIDDQMTKAVSTLSDLLTAVRRNQVRRLAELAKPLADVSNQLDKLEQIV